jgi:energy-coupling factor transport system permease protein
MLVTWQYRERRSLIQWFDPRAWLIYYACHLATTLLFWDARYLFVLFVVAMIWVFTSGINWREMRRAWLFIGGFVIFFTVLTFITGRGGTEVYDTETLVRRLQAPFTILGWQPTLDITLEKTFFALSQMMRVSSLAALTIMIPYSLDPSKYGITFRGLGLPDKIAYAMDLTMRFIPSFGRDFQLTLDAQKARGYELEKLKGGLFAQARPADGPGDYPLNHRQRGYHRRYGPARFRHPESHLAGAAALQNTRSPADRLRLDRVSRLDRPVPLRPRPVLDPTVLACPVRRLSSFLSQRTRCSLAVLTVLLPFCSCSLRIGMANPKSWSQGLK